MQSVGYLVAAIVGGLLGWLLCAVLLRRQEHRPDPVDDAGPRLAAEILRHSPHGYAVVDAESNVLLANDMARRLGVVRAGMIDGRLLDAVGRAQVSGEPVDVDLTAADAGPDRPSGRRGATSVHAEVTLIDGGRVLISASDDSAARRVEAVRRDFVANVSHELKTPVSAIVLLAEAVRDGADDAEWVRTFAGSMIRESTRLGTLVDELIALSRLQGADPLTDLVPIDVDAVVGAAIARAAAAAERSSITVTTDRPSGLWVRGERTLLVTAVANLIENAVNYSPEGSSVSVSRRLGSAADGEPTVEIAVTDRGIGIAPELQERVFERFFRIDQARSRSTGGTGLGLAIVKHVAVNHGGTATVWSRPSVGSTFTISLPAMAPSVDPPAPDVDLDAGPDPAGVGESERDSVRGTM